MAFHDVELPQGLQYASIAGPGFGTIVNQTASGHETRVARQAQGRHRFRLIKELQTQAEAKALKAFALGRRGAFHSWKLKDFSDYTTAEDGESAPTAVDQIIGVGDDVEDTFPLRKVYDASGADPYQRMLTLPVTGTVLVAINTVPTTSFTVNGQGEVVLDTPPADAAVVTAGCEFRVPVRFGLDFDRWAQLRADFFQGWSLPTLDAIEVLSEVELPERWHEGGGREWGDVAVASLSLNDGLLQFFDPSGASVVYLPPPGRIPSGDRIFTIAVDAGAGGTLQIKDALASDIGSPLNPGDVQYVGLIRGATTSTWFLH